MKVSQLDYCQYLLVSQINFTITNFADDSEKFSHDAVNRYLANEKLRQRLIWENVKTEIEASENGYLLFDDTVIDKRHSFAIELVRRQWSGNAKRVIKGIAVVTCVYVNPDCDKFWLIDYRLYDPEGDGKTKLHHVEEMLLQAVHAKQLSFSTVLMDSWYAVKDLMLTIERLDKIYYCPIKTNRRVDDSNGEQPYCHVKDLVWDKQSLKKGKRVKLKGFPKNHKLQLFRVTLSTHRTDFVVTNDLTQDSMKATKKISGFRWKIEQLHRETKQLTGLQSCQCRKARIQRNHIACALLVWLRLNQLSKQTQKNLYQLKQGLLDDYLSQQLNNPSLKMTLA